MPQSKHIRITLVSQSRSIRTSSKRIVMPSGYKNLFKSLVKVLNFIYQTSIFVANHICLRQKIPRISMAVMLRIVSLSTTDRKTKNILRIKNKKK